MKAGICESLHEVAKLVAAGEASSLALGNFLAFLKPEATQEAICEVPDILTGQRPNGDLMDAYLAAVAETLALRQGLQPPAWTEGPSRFLGHFHFPGRSKRLNDLLLQETPEPFRRRGIVVSSNIMDVA